MFSINGSFFDVATGQLPPTCVWMFLVPRPDQVRGNSVKCCSCHNNVLPKQKHKNKIYIFVILDVVSFSSLTCVRGDQLLRGAALNAVLIAEAKLRWENDSEFGAKSLVTFLLMNDVTDLLMDQHSRLGFLPWGEVLWGGERGFSLEYWCDSYSWRWMTHDDTNDEVKTSRAAELQNVLSHSCLQCLKLGHLENCEGVHRCVQRCVRCSANKLQPFQLDDSPNWPPPGWHGLACRIHWQVGWNGGNPPRVTWHKIAC